MVTTKEQRKRTKKFEGLRLKAYPDCGGRMTIGYGHLIDKQKTIKKINFAEANILFANDMKTVEKQVTKLNLNLNQDQFDAVCDFVYNVGIGKFKHSTLYQLIRNNNKDTKIMIEFMKWTKVNGTISKGLQKRRKIEYLTYFTQELFRNTN